MKAQVRTYLLVIGRNAENEPYRQLSPYRVPLPGLTDNYEDMSPGQIRQAKRAIEQDISLLEDALKDLEVEAFNRLERLT